MTESLIRNAASSLKDSQSRKKKDNSSAILSTNRRVSGTCSGDEPLWTLSEDAGDTTERIKGDGRSERRSEMSASKVNSNDGGIDEDSDQTFDEMEATENSKKN